MKESPIIPKTPEIQTIPEKLDPKLPIEKPGIIPKEEPEKKAAPEILPSKQ